MDAVEFLKTYRRMCSINACAKCPLWVDEHYVCMMDGKVIDKAQSDESKVVSIVEQWAKDHPVKTRQSELLKMFPNANRDEDGTPYACPEIFEPGIKTKCDGNCNRCEFKRDYWLQEVE